MVDNQNVREVKAGIDGKNGYVIPCIYRISGNEKIVCIVAHGFGSSKESPTARMMLENMPRSGIGVLAIDFPSHGESPVEGDFLTAENCISDLEAAEEFARSLSPGAEIVYFGSSFGAFITLNYMNERLEGCHRAFFRCAAVNMPEVFRDKTPQEEAELAETGAVTMGAEYGYVRPLRLTQRFFDSLDERNLFEYWKKGEAIIAMVHGDNDETIPFSEAKRFSEKFGVPMAVIPGGDHRLSIPGAPEEVLRLALEFFEKGRI